MIQFVTIVVRTRNGIQTARQTFAALRSQTVTASELIVMDCMSTDGVRELARQYGARIVDVQPEEYFPGKVLNRAVREARGDIVVFVNSDTVPLGPSVLHRLLEPFARPDVVATFGRQTPRPEALAWVRRDYEAAFPESGPAPDWLPLSLPLSAIRREALLERPFYTEAWASEDTEWGVRAREAGQVVEYVPEAVAMHSHNYTLSEIWGRRFVEGEADAFITPELRTGFAGLARRFAAAVVRDLAWTTRAGEWGGMLVAPIRRAVFWLAWARGHALGTARRIRKDLDASLGQQTILQLRRDA
jgi:rhamnosyltransferase